MDVEQPTRPDNLWFEDGNIVFQAGNTQYRLYRGTLARHSSVFKDMLSFPQPIDAEMVEGWPLVRLPDPEAQVTPLLPSAIRSYTRSWDSPTIFGGPRTDLVSVIRLAREVGALWVLPAAFYELKTSMADHRRKGMRDEWTGSTLDPQDQTSLVDGGEEQTMMGFRIVQIIQRHQATELCVSPQKCLSRRLQMVQYSDSLPGYLSDPLTIWSESGWDSEENDYFGVCVVCVEALHQDIDNALASFWDRLPGIYRLPPWDELETLRQREIGDAFMAWEEWYVLIP
ncbi:hypothetical protein HMN09_00008000 [Mycena chlorophos]|uniref:BTB domain-containing protein n=1 Tax=Mycena chlorophos TaxID=658473 RepID=A0A8H6WKS4_MYCCL|nr:hypothetical protein HMN09_00008000 [Mycena chlorophos]